MEPQSETSPNPHQTSQTTADGSTNQGATSPSKEAKTGIGGCLLYPLVFLIAQPILFAYMLLTSRKSPFPMATYRIVWPYLIYDLLLVGAVAILLRLFVSKKEILPAMFVLFLLAFAVLSGLLYSTLGRLSATRVTGRDPLSGHLVMLLQCLVLVPYFALSDRVRRTFINESDHQSIVDRLIERIANPARQIYGWLAGRGTKAILLALAFVIAVLLFDWAVDSIVLKVLLS